MTTQTDPAASLPEFATRDQVARHLQVSLSTVDRLRRRGALPAQKFGTLVRFHASAVRSLAPAVIH